MVALELDDIQGNILRGYPSARAAYLFFEVPDAGAGRRFLGELVDGVRTATDWGPVRPVTTTNIAVTYAGLQALGVPAALLEALPPAFCEPIRARAARLLDDTGPSAPDLWDDGFGTERSHILVIVNGIKASGGTDAVDDEAFSAVTDGIRQAAGRHGVTLVHEQAANSLEKRREHFGWADGFGQPAIAGTPWPSKPGQGVPVAGGGWRDVKAGEFVHGYPDEDGQIVSGLAADMLRNGTFMVYRKLYQDVALFRNQLYEDAQLYGRALSDDPPLDPDQLYELMAAKVVGRWRDGMSIEKAERRPDAQSRRLGDQELPDPDNDFRYLPGDNAGLLCPTGAHIRRTNPRDAIGWHGDGRMSLSHRIIRRGMPYGPFMATHKGQNLDGLSDDQHDRGLIFVCFNASLERQFEIVQRQWCNDGNAFRLANEKDYLLGDTSVLPTSGDPSAAMADGRVSTGRVTIPGMPPHFVTVRTPVVLTRGCEYLLMPGMASLRALASGTLDAGGDDVPPGEPAAIDRILAITKAKLEKTYPPDVRPVLRDQHAKSHGLLRADFVVGEDVPEMLRHGVLSQPGTFPAWIRFSSSAGLPKPPPDSKRDARGMAIKVMGVEGTKVMASQADATTQDFVLANSKVFFCRNASDYAVLAAMTAEGKFLRYFIGWNPAKWHLHELVNLIGATQRKVGNPLQIEYWSQTPSALGPHAVKYSAKPRSVTRPKRSGPAGENSLEDAIKRQLASGECCFDFMVQVRTDAKAMPIEDPTIRWKERLSPFQKVATLRIAPQDFTSEARKAFAENLSFTPWHALPAHRPLGGINRVRRAVYDVVSTHRHEKNVVAQHEPTGDELP